MIPLVIVLAVAIGADAGEYNNRYRRGSAGAFSGVSNGQFYGGTYHAPDNGPPVVNRFGTPPAHGSGFPVIPPLPFPGSTYAAQFPFGPSVPPFQNPLEFNNFFHSYFKTLNDNLAAAGKYNKPFSTSSSRASFSFDETPSDDNRVFAKNFEFQRAAYEAAQKAFQSTAQNRFGSEGYGPNFNYASSGGGGGGGGGGGSNYGGAAASASFGQGGGHQSAGVYPENPNNPNIHNRFSSSGPGKGGTYGVSTSSFSASSDVGGKKTSYKEASTSINDNGKITTHTVRS